jgi:hypothetical protein
MEKKQKKNDINENQKFQFISNGEKQFIGYFISIFNNLKILKD